MSLKNEISDYYSGDRREVVNLLSEVDYKNVLEIGAGDGAFVKYLNKNCSYSIVEPEDVDLLYPDRVKKVYKGLFEDVFEQFPENYFDLVICNDVIEHMSNHDFFFNGIKSKMSMGGRIVGSIPNVRHVGNIIEIVIKKNWRYANSGFFDRTHLRFFTEKSLKSTFNEHNYTIEKFQFLNHVTCSNYLSFKCIVEKLIVILLGNDSNYIQFGFLIKK